MPEQLPTELSGRFAITFAALLSYAAGATDAFAFLNLGSIFTANMTGNLVLAGLLGRPDYLGTLIGAATAITAFAIGIYLAAVLTEPARRSRRSLLTVLIAGTAAQTLVLVLWLGLPSPLPLWQTSTLIALSAAAMGGQTVLARRVETASGVTTTFVTGTLTSLLQSFADKQRGARLIRLAVVIALVVGAFSGSALNLIDSNLAAALPLLPSLAAIAVLARAPLLR